MSVFGVDYAWGRPGVAALKKAGAQFACRYLSHDTTGKNLSPSEANELSAGGISIVVVWEGGASRALDGHDAGASDAREAAKQAKACGMPDSRPIYFAVDFDASSGQQADINAYLDGAASVIGRDRVGIYGGYGPVKRALDGGHATWAWQTYAWSGGAWDARAQLRQYSNDHTINGVGLDYDSGVKTDFGQWKVGADMDLTDPVSLMTKDKNGKPVRLWAGDIIGADQVSVNYALGLAGASTYYLSRTVMPQLQAANAAIAALTKTVTDLAANTADLHPEELIAKIKAEIESVTVHLDVPEVPPAGPAAP